MGNFQEFKAKTCLLFQESVKVLRLTLPNDLPGDRQAKQKVRSPRGSWLRALVALATGSASRCPVPVCVGAPRWSLPGAGNVSSGADAGRGQMFWGG